MRDSDMPPRVRWPSCLPVSLAFLRDCPSQQRGRYKNLGETVTWLIYPDSSPTFRHVCLAGPLSRQPGFLEDERSRTADGPVIGTSGRRQKSTAMMSREPEDLDSGGRHARIGQSCTPPSPHLLFLGRSDRHNAPELLESDEHLAILVVPSSGAGDQPAAEDNLCVRSSG